MTTNDPGDPAQTLNNAEQVGIGAALRGAREKLNLTVPDLAYRVRLEPRVVRHLEAGEFDRLPAPAFVRGYLRALAKELALDASAIVSRYDAHGNHDAPSLSDFESRAPLQITSNSNIVRYTTVAVITAMLVLVGLWWKSHRESFSLLQVLPEPIPAKIETEPPATPLPYTFAVVTHSDAPGYRAPDPEPGDTTTAETPTTPAPTPNDATAGLAAPAAPRPVSTSERTPATAAQERGAQNSEKANEKAVAPLPAPGPSPADLVLSSSADAWVQVTDARGERLFYNLVRPGREVRLGGRHPYQLVIGNAPAVRLNFAGRAIDVAAAATDGVAHLQLGGTNASSQDAVVDEH